MRITTKIYTQACKALKLGYRYVLISKAKKGFKNGQAKGPTFYIVSLQTIKFVFKKTYRAAYGRFLQKNETIKLNKFNIKFSHLMKLKYPDESILNLKRKYIPSLLHYSTNLKEALEKKYWFLDTEQEPHYIFVDWENYPGVFTHNIKTKKFIYREGDIYMIETNNLDNLRRLIK